MESIAHAKNRNDLDYAGKREMGATKNNMEKNDTETDKESLVWIGERHKFNPGQSDLRTPCRGLMRQWAQQR